jgi:hypothetical protein
MSDYTVFAMSPEGNVVESLRCYRTELADVIDRLLEDAGEDGAPTYVEVHDGSCDLQ